MNINTLQHPTVKLNFVKAMHEAINTGVSHIENKKGYAYIAVRYVTCNDGKKRFQFLDNKGKNIASDIAQAFVCKKYNRALSRVLVGKIAYNMYISKV